jgi:hypothetical protein
MNWFWSNTQTHNTHTEYNRILNHEKVSTSTSTPPRPWCNLDFLLLQCVFRYSKTRLAIVQFGKMLHDKWPAIRCLTANTHTITIMIGAVFSALFCSRQRYYTEPTAGAWSNIVSLIKHPPKQETPDDDLLDTSSSFTIEEQYNECNIQEFLDKTTTWMDYSNMEFQRACNSASRIFDNQPNVEEIVVWTRNIERDEQIVRVWTSHTSVFPTFTPTPNYTNIKFVYVEYQHPKMNGVTIELFIPRSLLVVGNELFSAGFICRWLNYFAECEFVFDDNYILRIMDDNINQYTLLYGDYVVLEKDGLVKISPPTSSGETSEIEDDSGEDTVEEIEYIHM